MSFSITKAWNNTILKRLLVVVLILLTVFYTLPWTVLNSLVRSYSGEDFQDYWYAGHYLRQGVNSYAAIFNDPNPNYWDPRVPGSGDPNIKPSPEYSLKLPIYYLDGFVVSKYPVAQTLIVSPSITAPLHLLLELFAWFSWPTARFMWMVFNLAFAAVIPWLAVRLVEERVKLTLLDKLVFALVFYNLYGLRQSIVIGQQTLVSLLLLILALLFRKKWLISGLLLGFGISKYSVGLPVFLYLLMQKEYRTIFVSAVVQVIGVLILVPLKWGSPVETFMAYYRSFEVNASQDGVYLLARFQEGSIKTALFLVILAITVSLLTRQYLRWKKPGQKGDWVGLNELNLITLAVFMLTYHRIHDMPFIIFFLLPLTIVLEEIKRFQFTQSQKGMLYICIILLIPFLISPTWVMHSISALGSFFDLSERWVSVEAASSIALIFMFAISIWVQMKMSPSLTSLEKSTIS